MTRYDAYVLRFWRSTGKEGPQWKGRLEHLGHSESAQFDDLEALLRHIRSIAGVERDGGTHAIGDQPRRDQASPS